jgi:hypothetical protein
VFPFRLRAQAVPFRILSWAGLFGWITHLNVTMIMGQACVSMENETGR